MPRRTAGPGLGNRDGGAVLGSESMCNYTDNLPCRRMSIRACWGFFFGWLVSCFGGRAGVDFYLFLLHVSVVLRACRDSQVFTAGRSCEAFSSACL